MSKVHPLIDGWIGYGNGGAIQVEVGQEFDENDPVVLERPELFTKPELTSDEKAIVGFIATAPTTPPARAPRKPRAGGAP